MWTIVNLFKHKMKGLLIVGTEYYLKINGLCDQQNKKLFDFSQNVKKY